MHGSLKNSSAEGTCIDIKHLKIPWSETIMGIQIETGVGIFTNLFKNGLASQVIVFRLCTVLSLPTKNQRNIL